METGLGGQRFFYEQGFPVPRILAVDDSCTIFKHPYVIEEYVRGTRLGTLLDQVSDAEAKEIFETIGRLFRRIHSILGKRSGIWLDGDPEKVVGSPNDYMFRVEILEGSGRKALEQRRVSLKTYYRAVALWARNMDYLNDHQATLVHGSPFLGAYI
ncbi:MAG: phosphotransferase [Candidatus Bathyarchaeota archaeon]|nr:phosphotransferase [Candidatus Bathyarchaeota archaeon]MDH5687466.1 phosphotransferase [Candidatus Bathyarchaeota archaeon]